MKRIANILESIVVGVILAALVHTFLEDCSILAGWTVAARRWIIWAGLGIDLFFTIEFFTRLYMALTRGEGADYIFRQRGWIDFLASVPLLIFNSLPGVLALLAGAGLVTGVGSFLNILKVIKAVRIARILRLLRVVKLFRSIRYARSPLAQRHVATIITISVTVLVVTVLAGSLLANLGILPGLEASFQDAQSASARAVSAPGLDAPARVQTARQTGSIDASLLVVRQAGGKMLWTRYDQSYYENHFIPGEYGYYNLNGVETFFDERPLARATAREGIVFFVAIVISVLAWLFLYSPRFALGISDPLHVMRRGMKESGYNLEVKIPQRAAEDDDVFELARLYNSVFLPLKDRESDAGEQAPALALDDVRSLVEKG